MSNNSATDFSQIVKMIVKTIPPGSVMSYKDVAVVAGKPSGARVVARIMSENYDPDIPCHRVIRSDGTLGGYNRGGTRQKYALLFEEGYKVQ